MATKNKTKKQVEPPKGKSTANVSLNTKGKPTGKKGLAYDSNPKLVYSKYPEGTVTDTVQDLYKGKPRNASTPKADSYKIKNPDEALGRTSGYLNRESRAYTLPMKEMKTNMPEKLKKGGVIKTTYKEGGSTKPKCPMGMAWDPSSKKCVKPGTKDTPLDILKKEKARMLKTNFKSGGMVNPNAKLVAAKTVKKPAKPRSIAPKKAIPKAKYGITMTKMKKR